MEVSFRVEADALLRLCPDMDNTEDWLLRAFDSSRSRIYQVANKVHAQHAKGIYAHVLNRKDF